MKVLYKSPGGKYQVELEGSTIKEVWKKAAEFAEAFEMYGKHCDVETTLVVRTIDGNDFFEKKCPKCGQTFSYGQNKVGGGVFPNSKKGWHKWTPGQTDDEDAPQAAPFAGKNNSGANQKGKGR